MTMKEGAFAGIGWSELFTTTAFLREASGEDCRSKARLFSLASRFIPLTWLLCNFATHRHEQCGLGEGVLLVQHLFSDCPPDCIQQRLCLGRLDEIVHHTLFEERGSSMDIGVARQCDDRDRRKLRPDECNEVMSIHLWQFDIADNYLD